MTCSNCLKPGHRKDRCPEPARGAAPSPLLALAATVATADTIARPAIYAPAHETKLDRIRREAAELAPGMFGVYLWVDAACIAAQMTPTSAWWKASLRAFYASGKRWGIWMVGRGGAKSTTLERVAATDALLTPRSIPTGQTWVYPFVSIGPDDANRRIRGIESVYRSGLGLDVTAQTSPRAHLDIYTGDTDPRKPAGEERATITLASVAGTIGNLSGLNALGLIVDEAGKLHDKSTNANPLSELIASVIGAFRARPDIRAIVCSSAWYRAGAFFDMIEAGDTETNYIARLGAEFVDAAREGLHAVAAWEEAGDAAHLRAPDPEAARAIRAHAASLTAESPAIPSWVANTMYGATPALAAIATRIEVQALPPKLLDGLPRHVVWLREIASVPVAGDENGVDFSEQCMIANQLTAYLAQCRDGGRQPTRSIQSHPLAQPGDARYAGAPAAPPGERGTWRTRIVF